MIIEIVSNGSSISDDTTKWPSPTSSFSDDPTKRIEDSNVGSGGPPPPGPSWNDDDLPPPYEENPESETPSSMPPGPSLSLPCATPPTTPHTVPNIRPSNFVSLVRVNESIKGSWLIDPSLSIPESLLPPRPAGGGRFNLSLESKNGAIEADLYILPTRHSNRNLSKYVFIHTQSTNGSIKTKLHDTESGEGRLAVRLSTRSSNGSIQVQLPRSFRGPIRIRTINGTTHFSAAIQAHLTQFSELNHVQRSFLGPFDPSQWKTGAQWEGDELSIESKNGSVRVAFDNESNPPVEMHGQSFFYKVFS